MRIALVSSTLPPEGLGGAEAYAAQLAAWLGGRHEVLVLSGARAGEPPGVEHARLPPLPPLPHEASARRKAVWHARDQWRPVVHLALLHELRRFRPAVVNTHEPQGLSAAVFSAIAQAGVPHVHTAHDLNALCLRTSMTRDGVFCGGGCTDCRIQRLVRGGLLRRHLSRLVAVSDYIRARHVEAGIATGDTAVTIRLGVEPGDKRVRRREGERVRLGFIGTVARHKGIPTLLAALPRMPGSWSLAIAGRGPLESEVRRAAAADPRLSYLGHVSGESKEAFFAGLDVLVIPSEWEEPAALVGLEAAVRGVPTVASDRGGLPELPDVTAFTAGQPEEMIAAVERIVGTPGELERRSERLLQRAPLLTWSRHAERVERVLEEAAADAHGAT